MNSGIYKITSPTGKIYIGQTTNFNRRKSWYKNLHSKQQPKIHNSLLKYGFENHIWEEIELCNPYLLNEREIFWKKYYLSLFENKWDKVLFCEIYDSGGGPMSDITKSKISKSNKGKKRSLESIKNISKGLKGRKIKWINKIITPERNKNISNANKGKILGDKGNHPERIKNQSKQIIQKDKNNIIINMFSSINEASRYLSGNNSKVSGISNCLNKRSKSSFGYVWEYK